ncbi:MAG: MoaD/ThiS family protein [Planctomycetota bacterium]
MARIAFTENLRRHVACPPSEVAGTSVREALQAYFARHAEVRGYVLDDQGALRRHVVVFVDGHQIADRTKLSDPVAHGGEIFVAQALSGG